MTFAVAAAAAPQINVATEGGSGTAVPDLSIEVDDLECGAQARHRQRLHDRVQARQPSRGACDASMCATHLGGSLTFLRTRHDWPLLVGAPHQGPAGARYPQIGRMQIGSQGGWNRSSSSSILGSGPRTTPSHPRR